MKRLLLALAFAAGGCAGGPEVGEATSAQRVAKFDKAVLIVGQIKEGIGTLEVRPETMPDRAVEIEIVVAGIKVGTVHYERSDYPLNKQFLIAVDSWSWMEARIGVDPSKRSPAGIPDPGAKAGPALPNWDGNGNPQGPPEPGPGNPAEPNWDGNDNPRPGPGPGSPST